VAKSALFLRTLSDIENNMKQTPIGLYRLFKLYNRTTLPKSTTLIQGLS